MHEVVASTLLGLLEIDLVSHYQAVTFLEQSRVRLQEHLSLGCQVIIVWNLLTPKLVNLGHYLWLSVDVCLLLKLVERIWLSRLLWRTERHGRISFPWLILFELLSLQQQVVVLNFFLELMVDFIFVFILTTYFLTYSFGSRKTWGSSAINVFHLFLWHKLACVLLWRTRHFRKWIIILIKVALIHA